MHLKVYKPKYSVDGTVDGKKNRDSIKKGKLSM